MGSSKEYFVDTGNIRIVHPNNWLRHF